MQSDVPPLPISCLTDNTSLRRKSRIRAKLSEENSKKADPPCKSNASTVPLPNRKRLRPVLAGVSPYKNTARFNPPDTAKSISKSAIDQRVTSAKMLRIKQLQNQLADAHFHLNELANENKLLKAIQKRQETALKRYEGTKAELPRIMNTHQEDLRVLQTKYKKLSSQYKAMSDMLKEKENELHSLQAQNKKLVQLSKDRHLGEREKLQTQVYDLSHRVNQQDEIIQTLKRKLALESKYLKHQLHVEMVKHKETQKQLRETQLKLKSSEELAEQREKQSYHASRVFFKDRPAITTQSLTNLHDRSRPEIGVSRVQRRRRNESSKGQSLPALGGSTSRSLPRSLSQEAPRRSNLENPRTTTKTTKTTSTTTSEPLLDYEEKLRQYRHDKSPAVQRTATAATAAAALPASKASTRDSPLRESLLDEMRESSKASQTRSGANAPASDSLAITYELPKTLKEEFAYESLEHLQSTDSLDNNRIFGDSFSLTSRSRFLHTRLVSSAVEGTRTNKERVVGDRSRSFSKENIEKARTMNEEEKETKYDRDSVVTVIAKDVPRKSSETSYTGTSDSKIESDSNYSSSDLESEMEIPVAYVTEEEENVARKSDIMIDRLEIEKEQIAAATLPKSLTQFRSTSTDSFKFEKDTDPTDYGKTAFKVSDTADQLKFKSMNGLTVYSDLFTDTESLVDHWKVQSHSIFPEKMLFFKDTERKSSLIEENPLLFNETIKVSSRENDEKDATKVETFSQTTKNSEDYSKNSVLHDDTYNLKNSDSKNNVEQKVNNENSKGYDKAKLLAAMKAIDDNENIEFIEQKPRRNSGANRLQITENLYRGVPTHAKRKTDLMKELFSDLKTDNLNHGKEN